MAHHNYDRALHHLLISEGGFVNHPRDPGGATNKGVTLATYRRFYGRHMTVDDLKNIRAEHLGRIYRVGYWDKANCQMMPCGLDYVVFDGAVNSGPRRSVRWLQEALGLKRDGLAGPKTRAAVWATSDPVRLVKEVLAIRLGFLQRLGTWDAFGRGWSNRLSAVSQEALRMIQDDTHD